MGKDDLKNKKLNIKSDRCELKAIAFSNKFEEQRRNLSVTLIIKKLQTIRETSRLSKEYKDKLQEWFENSSKYIPEHFIPVVNGPDGYKEMNDDLRMYYWKLEVNVCLKPGHEVETKIQMQELEDEMLELIEVCLSV
jgi:hypothetical protein